MLEQAFGDLDKQATAQWELCHLNQANLPFLTFIATFCCLAPDTGFDEMVLKSILSRGISYELTNAMITYKVPSKLDDYIELLQKVDNKIVTITTMFTPTICPSDSASNFGATPMDLSSVQCGLVLLEEKA
ncbi:hypothetical protein L228DRAFT_271795 [Xylona heveae TC161]|uniref:Uncharacterized protein n=1 Tax=Xylona heveae (strain CBS 132557 / TC161) TaxID=1328760 RepID=A0A164ZBG8_XYLHT|nr:hypothetical protein L228DRAFT_271795 [Xylona heveae TC161]KZF18897.1 hypothetical protein L228DRAFT_271795 [Xylona heveae TC161]